MSERQIYLDQVRELIEGLTKELRVPKIKDSENFCIKEALVNLETAKEHINSYLQVDKYYGN